LFFGFSNIYFIIETEMQLRIEIGKV